MITYVIRCRDTDDDLYCCSIAHHRPHNCPDVIYDMMCHCHDHDREQRPNFTEILSTLESAVAGSPITTDDNEPSVVQPLVNTSS